MYSRNHFENKVSISSNVYNTHTSGIIIIKIVFNQFRAHRPNLMALNIGNSIISTQVPWLYHNEEKWRVLS